MNFSKYFILHRVTTILICLSIILFGVWALFKLPVDQLPNVDFPTILVNAELAGANATTMAATVATPLEKQFSNIAGLKAINTQCSYGICQITLEFEINRNIDGAAADVQSAIAIAHSLLPVSMILPPTFHKVNPTQVPIFVIAIYSATLPMYKVDEYAENLIAQRLSMINGIGQVAVLGSQTYAVRVQLNPKKLKSYNIGFDQIINIIQKSNVNLPCGIVSDQYKDYSIVVNGQLHNAKSYEPIIINYQNGHTVRLKDVATVIDSVQSNILAAWYNNKRSVILAVMKQPNSNTVEITNHIKAILPKLKIYLPESVQADVIYDRSKSIRNVVNDVKLNLILSIILVIMVIFIFSGDFKSTLIPSLSLPVSILGTFAIIYVLGFSINNITLIAIILSVGFVVDDAIVVLENILRNIDLNKNIFQSCLIGSNEVVFTVISMTLSLAVAFIPALFLGGLLGKLIFQFSVTIIVSIIISGLVSLTLIPMLSSLLINNKLADTNYFSKIAQFLNSNLLYVYDYFLKLALYYKKWIMATFLVSIVLTIWLFSSIAKNLITADDIGYISGTTQACQGISFNAMVNHQQKVTRIICNDPAVQGVASAIGVGSLNDTINTGKVFIVLKPMNIRKINAQNLIERLNVKLEQIPGIITHLQLSPPFRFGGKLTNGLYQLTLTGANLKLLFENSKLIEHKMRQLKMITDLSTDLETGNPEICIDINREQCARFGLSIKQVENVLNCAFSSRHISTIYKADSEYWVFIECLPEFRESVEALQDISILSNTGKLISLKNVAQFNFKAEAQFINHFDEMPSITISFNLKPGYALGQAINEVNNIANKYKDTKISCCFQGQAQEFNVFLNTEIYLIIISILIIYIILGILYESFIHPITILSGLPSAALGGLLSLIFFNLPLDIYGFLGLILLIGIVKKNSIIMLDFAIDQQRKTNIDAQTAIYQACLVRFRPIMMTTLCAIFGSLPLVLELGSGAQSRQPLGLIVLGGLILSQLVTLFITPVIYIYFDKVEHKLMKLNFYNFLYDKNIGKK